MSENGRQRFLELLQNLTGILLLYPQGSVEILDDSDDVENRWARLLLQTFVQVDSEV